MDVSKKRIRKEFAPLNLALGLTCGTPNSPVQQVYNAKMNEWEPDRTVSPTVVMPNVVASAPDGSWSNGRANNLLANMIWKVDGVDITTIPAWNGKYTIEQSGLNRGALTITRNLYPSERFVLAFEAVIPDNRFGINVPVSIDGITLGCSDKSDDDYSLSIGDDQIIQYNPFKDGLLLYDYKVGQGIIAASEPVRLTAIDENAYEREIAISIHKGAEAITTGFDLKLYKISGVTLIEVSATDYEIMALTVSVVKLDLRLIEKGDYMLKVLVDDVEKAHKQFSVLRVYPAFLGEVASSAAIHPQDSDILNFAQISYDGQIVPYPEAMLSILWKTDAYATSGTHTVTHNEGQQALINLAQAGIGDSYIDDWLDIYFSATQNAAMGVATDEAGDTLTDESGNILII